MTTKTHNSALRKIETDQSIVNQMTFVSLNEMVKGFDDELQLIDSWMSCKETLDFLNVWEEGNNASKFNAKAFEKIRSEVNKYQMNMTIQKWIDKTHAMGIVVKSEPMTEIYAHPDIAFEFGTWLNPQFKLFIIKEFQRLKDIEKPSQSIGWQANRVLAKINYRVQSSAIKQHLLDHIDPSKQRFVYAREADLLNKVVFSESSKHWHKTHPELVGNQRDYASTLDAALLANLEVMNAALIERGLTRKQRNQSLTKAANKLRCVLQNSPTILKIDREITSREDVKLLH